MTKVSKAVVTGGAGFIGSRIVDELLSRGIETYVVDNLSTGSLTNLSAHKDNKLLHVFIGSIRDIGSILDKVNGIDVVFHEAAIASVPISVQNPLLVHDTNTNMTLELMNFRILICQQFVQKDSNYSAILAKFLPQAVNVEISQYYTFKPIRVFICLDIIFRSKLGCSIR
jgi:nucleoside-diphosphate-sugar epimerase